MNENKQVSPQGYVITVNPTNNNPFWDQTPPPVPAGEGIPKGGTKGQVLTKASDADYDADWQTPTGGGAVLPAGVDGDILCNNAGEWVASDPQVAIPELNDLAGGVSALEADTAILKNGGTAGQVLTKGDDGANTWKTPVTGWVPPTGTQDQTLVYDAAGELQAVDVGYIPEGGTNGQVLTKNGDDNFNVIWGSPSVAVTNVVVFRGVVPMSVDSDGNYSGATGYTAESTSTPGGIHVYFTLTVMHETGGNEVTTCYVPNAGTFAGRGIAITPKWVGVAIINTTYLDDTHKGVKISIRTISGDASGFSFSNVGYRKVG